MADRLTIAERRARLGRDALYAAREAAELLPGKTADNLAAFDEAEIVHWWEGRRYVLWGDVIRLVTGKADAIETAAMPTAPNGRRPVKAAGLPEPANLD